MSADPPPQRGASVVVGKVPRGDRGAQQPARVDPSSRHRGQPLSEQGSEVVGMHVRGGPLDELAPLPQGRGGLAGEASVEASLRALRTQGMDAVRLVTHTDPADQLAALAHYCAVHDDCNVVGVHLFTFGGVTSSAAWMNRYIALQGSPA